MAEQTNFERWTGRDPAARERARMEPTLGDDDTDTFPILTEEGAVATPVGDDTDTVPILTEEGAVATPVSDDTSDEWQVGDIVAGRFVLRQRLGKGRYGPIFKALDRALSEPQIGVEHHVVLEELPPWIAERGTFIERLQELRLNPQSWSHPNIAKVLEFGRDGAKYYFCGELLEGASLRVVLNASAPDALEEHEVLAIVRKVGDALSFAHAKGIVHGDLRLDNVFVTETYEVKLTGFLPSTEPRPDPVFVEDRNTSGRPHLSDDVYGVACLAYELLTRHHPYGGHTPIQALRAGLSAHPVANLSPPQWQVLLRGLALRREHRPSTIAELLLGLGVTGDETLRPAPKNLEPAAPSREAAPAEPTPWPEITLDEPARSSPRRVARLAAAAPAPEPFTTERPPDRFDEIYREPMATVARPRRRRRPTSPVRAILGVIVAAGFAAFAYVNQAWLRDRASGVMETAAALVMPPRSMGTANAPSAAAPSAAAPTAAAPPSEPPAATPPSALTEAALPSAPAEAAPPAAPPAIEAAPPDVSTPVPEPESTPSTVAPPHADLPAPAQAPSQPAAVPPAASPQFRFAERTLTVSEAEGSARVLIRRTGPLDEEASVVWWTTDGTAVGDEDYAVLGARVARFKKGEDTQVLLIPLIADSRREPSENFVVNMRAERAGGAAMRLEVVVLDDDR